jgi:hypothetical protein
MSENVESTQRIWETIRPLLSYLEDGDYEDFQQLFTVIHRMIDNYPPILVRFWVTAELPFVSVLRVGNSFTRF